MMTKDEICKEFEIDSSELKGVKILWAEYEQGGYEGDVFVLFRRAGRLYSVEGSHCSCYGLEGQWSPVETTKEALAKAGDWTLAHRCYEEVGKRLRGKQNVVGDTR